jgi:hypothetical protein
VSRAKRLRGIVGWREWVALPELGVQAIKAKVDTGAASSSLHAFRMRRLAIDGVDSVEFEIHPVQHRSDDAVLVRVPVVDERPVRNPGGRTEVRPVIETKIRWGEEIWTTRINLTARDEMGFRMLLGRRTIRRRRLLVDPGRSFLGGHRDPHPEEA